MTSRSVTTAPASCVARQPGRRAAPARRPPGSDDLAAVDRPRRSGRAGRQHGVEDRRAAGPRARAARRPRGAPVGGWRRRWPASRAPSGATASTPSASDADHRAVAVALAVISATSDCRRSAMPLRLSPRVTSSCGRDAGARGPRGEVAARQRRGGAREAPDAAAQDPGDGDARPGTRGPSTTIIARITRRRTTAELGGDPARGGAPPSAPPPRRRPRSESPPPPPARRRTVARERACGSGSDVTQRRPAAASGRRSGPGRARRAR